MKKPCQIAELLGGSDGARTVSYDFSILKLHVKQEIIDPILISPRKNNQGRYSVPLTHIPQDQWDEVAQRHASGESLRLLAKHYSLSHEAVRQVLKKC